MALHLSSDALTRIAEAQTALLAPLGAGGAEGWADRVNEALGALFHASASFVVLPTAGHRVVFRNVDARVFEAVEFFVGEPLRNGEPPRDEAICQVEAARRAGGVGATTFPVLDRLLDGALDRSPFFHETVDPMGFRMLHGLGLPDGLEPGLKASVDVYHVRGERSPFGDDGLAVLELLRPAFRAGAGALARLGGHRAALDALDKPVGAYDAAGQTLHRTRAFHDALADDAQRATVEAAAAILARDLLAPGLTIRPERTVRTARGPYGLRATALPDGGPFGPAPAALVTVEPPTAPWPDEPELRKRFGLTRREAEVALLLARGLANDALAGELCISPHTARRHTERVMAKLDVASRAQVAAALLGPT